MTTVVKITFADMAPDGDHYTRWRYHLDSGEIIDATLSWFVRDPGEPSTWRYSLLTFDSGATILHIGAPLDLYVVNSHALFGDQRRAAEAAIGLG